MTGFRIIKSLTPFLRLGHRSAEYGQGYRAGTKACVTWLMNRSEELKLSASKADKLRAKALGNAAADMSREAKDIAFDGEEVTEGAFFDALHDLRNQMRGQNG